MEIQHLVNLLFWGPVVWISRLSLMKGIVTSGCPDSNPKPPDHPNHQLRNVAPTSRPDSVWICWEFCDVLVLIVFYHCEPALGCPRKLGSMNRINGLFSLLINRFYIGVKSPTDPNHLLTQLSFDPKKIQAEKSRCPICNTYLPPTGVGWCFPSASPNFSIP